MNSIKIGQTTNLCLLQDRSIAISSTRNHRTIISSESYCLITNNTNKMVKDNGTCNL